MATVVGPSFRVSFEPPGWATAPEADRLAFHRAVLAWTLVEKDRELAAGLDRYGRRMKRLAASTVKRRRSAMGPADPSAPPLQPAHGDSRTRSLLTGRATPTAAVLWWLVDPITRASWGEILKHHRKGGRRLPRRDVIGLSPRARERVKARTFEWWGRYQAGLAGQLTFEPSVPGPDVARRDRFVVVELPRPAKPLDVAVGEAAKVVEGIARGAWSGWHTRDQVDEQLRRLGAKVDADGRVDFAEYFEAKKRARLAAQRAAAEATAARAEPEPEPEAEAPPLPPPPPPAKGATVRERLASLARWAAGLFRRRRR